MSACTVTPTSSASSSASSSLTATTSEPSPCSAWAIRSSSQRLGVGALGRDDREVAGPREAVDADEARHLALGLLHPQAAGTHDDVDGPDRLGAVGERGDRLRAAHAVDLVGPAQRGCGEDDGMTGRGDDDLVDPRGTGGDGAHDHRRRVRVAAAGRVDGGAAHRHLAQPDRLPLGQRHLGFVVQSRLSHGADVRRRPLQAGSHVGIERLERGRELVAADDHGIVVAEPRLVLAHRVVAALAHRLQDRGDVDRLGDRPPHLRSDLGGRLHRALKPHGCAPRGGRSPPP